MGQYAQNGNLGLERGQARARFVSTRIVHKHQFIAPSGKGDGDFTRQGGGGSFLVEDRDDDRDVGAGANLGWRWIGVGDHRLS